MRWYRENFALRLFSLRLVLTWLKPNPAMNVELCSRQNFNLREINEKKYAQIISVCFVHQRVH